MKNTFFFLAAACCLFACTSENKTSDTTTEETDKITKPSLSKIWETDTLLPVVEAVIYDEANKVLYTGNIIGDPPAKDGVGSIGKVGLDGKIINANWISGLNAPKGMGIHDGKLYVADVDAVREIDIATATLTNTYTQEGAKFLNDISIATDGTIYVSDTWDNKIYTLTDGTFNVFMEDIQSPNGLLVEGDDLLTVLWDPGTFNRINRETKDLTPISDSIPNQDGIEPVADQGYLISSWNGLVHYVSKSGEKTLLLDTTSEEINAADIEYLAEEKTLIIPTFFKNQLTAYKLEY